MSESNSVSPDSFSGFGKIVKGIKFILISYIVSLLLIVLLAALLAYTSLPEAVSAPAVSAITYFAAFLSGFLTARSAGGRGWMWGMLSGIGNILLLSIAGLLLYSGAPAPGRVLVTAICGGIAGAVGGILGINSKKTD